MTTHAQSSPGLRELRIGLVLYGGVSLAIYIYGASLELLRLAQASRQLDGPGAKRDPSTLGAYAHILDKLGARATVDIIAGTSAGGINGVALAKALTQGTNLDGLRNVWVNEGDLESLLNPPRRKEVHSLINTEHYEAMVKKALDEMDDHADPNLRCADVLDLFVTSTDLRGRDSAVTDAFGAVIPTKNFRKVFHRKFRTRDYNQDDFQRKHNRLLATICHATSAFPFAIAPARLDAAQHGADPAEPGEEDVLYLADGGILDNKPFTEMLSTIVNRSADRPVDRVLCFVDPDPAPMMVQPAPGQTVPDALSVVFKAVFSIPRYESLVNDLRALDQHNERVKDLQEALNLAERETAVLAQFGQDWRDRLQRQAGYAFYQRVKVNRAKKRLSDAFNRSVGRHNPPAQEEFEREINRRTNGDQADIPTFLQAFDIAFQERRYYYLAEALARLYGHDQLKPYREMIGRFERRLWAVFGRARNTEWRAWNVGTADQPGRFPAELQALRTATEVGLRDKVQSFLAMAQEYLATELRKDVGAWSSSNLRSQAEQVCAELDQELARLKGDLSQPLTRAQQAELEKWFPKANFFAESLERYELRDVYLFPALAFAQFGERDPIDLVRISPRDAKHITRDVAGKLAGDAFFHFGGFLKKEWRQNDILWGRLDAAEILVRTLAHPQGLDPRQVDDMIERVQREIIDEERKQATIFQGLSPDNYRTFLSDGGPYKVGEEGPQSLDTSYLARLAHKLVRVSKNTFDSAQAAHDGGPAKWVAGKGSLALKWLEMSLRWGVTPVVEALWSQDTGVRLTYRYLLAGAWSLGAGVLLLLAFQPVRLGWGLTLAAVLALLPLWSFGWWGRHGVLRYVFSLITLLPPLAFVGSYVWGKLNIAAQGTHLLATAGIVLGAGVLLFAAFHWLFSDLGAARRKSAPRKDQAAHNEASGRRTP